MINLDQVRTLEWKVKKAVQLIVHLRRENDVLRGRLSDTEVRLQELETLLESFKATQNEMESGIRSALEELDHLEGEATAEVPSGVQTDAVSYPPEAVEEVPVAVDESPAVSDITFEEEYAALAAAEAASLVSEESVSTEIIQDVPDSVVLEEPSVEDPEEEIAEEVAAPVAAQEEREPEQPGLGIF